MFPKPSLVRRISQIGTVLSTMFSGICVGADAYGNRYFRSRYGFVHLRQKRWVLYAGEPEATEVPVEWHVWLHYMCDEPLPSDKESGYLRQRIHQSNLSGSNLAPLPKGHPLYACSQMESPLVQERYQSWHPPQSSNAK